MIIPSRRTPVGLPGLSGIRGGGQVSLGAAYGWMLTSYRSVEGDPARIPAILPISSR